MTVCSGAKDPGEGEAEGVDGGGGRLRRKHALEAKRKLALEAKHGCGAQKTTAILQSSMQDFYGNVPGYPAPRFYKKTHTRE